MAPMGEGRMKDGRRKKEKRKEKEESLFVAKTVHMSMNSDTHNTPQALSSS